MSEVSPDVDSRLEDDLSDDDMAREVYESFRAAEPSFRALEELAAVGTTDEFEHADDELINQEDPYLQELLAPAEYN